MPNKNIDRRTAERNRLISMINEGGRDVAAMLAGGHHPFEIVQISDETLEVRALPCGRPTCQQCGGTH